MTQRVSASGPASGPALRSHGARALACTLTFALTLAGSVARAAVPTRVTTHAHAAKLRHGAGEAMPSRAQVRRTSSRDARPAAGRAAVRSRGRRSEPARAHASVGMKRASMERGAAAPRLERASVPGHAVTAKAAAPVGGELTSEDFFRAAGASPEAKAAPAEETPAAPAAAPAERLERGESHPPEDNRVVLPPLAKAAPTPVTSPHRGIAAKTPQPSILLDDDAPEVASPAVADSRVAELAHPSHEEMAEEAVEPLVLPGLYRNGRLVVPAPLKGTHEILVHQNLMADDEGLERIRDDDALNRLRAAHQLVSLPESASLRVNPELNGDRRCARVWTVKFAEDMAKEFYARFHEPLQVNSAVRTIAYQVRLQRTNGNAAGIGGEVASPHLTGQAIDIGKRGMSVVEIAWMRAYLKPLMDAGKVDVEEEFQQACFHISVYKSYLPASRRGAVDVAQVRKPVVGEAVR